MTDRTSGRPKRRIVVALSTVPLVVPGVIVLPAVQFTVKPEPVSPQVDHIPLDAAAHRARAKSAVPLPTGPAQLDLTPGSEAYQPAVATEETATDSFRLVAATWTEGDARLVAWVRTRIGDGGWSQWYMLPGGDDHAANPGSAEAAQQRAGTDPLVVAESDAVQVRVNTPDGSVPRGLRLELINPGSSPADASVGTTGSSAVAAPNRPAILSRAQWGADESLRECCVEYGGVRGAFVHHTVNVNDYTAAEVPAIIRGIYAYHVNSRGWKDIGYNFLVDRFGRVWEGRYGGIDKPVIGAHTTGYNDDAFAMSAIGTYSDKTPETALLAAYQNVFAWKFAIHGVDPRKPVNYDGEVWPAVAGHRDAKNTECPGAALYARLSTIRAGTVARMGIVPALSLGRDISNDGYPDLLARTASDGSLWLWPGKVGGGFGSLAQVGHGWQTMSTIVMPGDANGDGADDVIATRASDGTLWFYSGNGSGGLRTGVNIGHGWSSFTALVAPGDFSGDGLVDLVGRRADGTLWLYSGTGTGRFRPAIQIGNGWNMMNAIVGPGDWGSDGRVDLIARRASDGSLWAYPGLGTGRFGKPFQIGNGWSGMNSIIGAGDVNRDGSMDLIARDAPGSMRLYPGSGVGGFKAPSQIGNGWNTYDLLI